MYLLGWKIGVLFLTNDQFYSLPVRKKFYSDIKLELNTEKEGCMSYTTPEDAQRPRAVYDIHPDFRGI